MLLSSRLHRDQCVPPRKPVLAESKQSPNIVPFSPELKNTSTASMLFVFRL
jgi:hypothetical protein